jgi:integrase
MPTVNLTARLIDSLKTPQKRTEYFDDDVPGLCLRITETGHKSWGLYYRFAGRQQRLSLGNHVAVSLRDARKKAKDALHDVEHGINPFAAKIETRNAETFKFVAQEFIERYAKKNKKSWEEDQRILNHDLIPAFGATRAKEITKRDVNAILERKAETAPIQANRMRSLLNKIFRWAITKDEFGIEHNPVYLTDRPGGTENERDRVLTETELKQVWIALEKEREADKAHRKYQTLSAGSLKLRILTAQRGGEVMGMEWGEIDGEWWTIPGNKTKNGLTHRVPLSPMALRIIEEMKAVAEGTGKKKKPLTNFVFPGPRGGHIENVQKAIQRIRKSTGIEFRGHDLRRTTATQMTSMGIPRLTVQKILNHVEPGVTKVYDRYSYDKEKREALEAWSKRLMILVSNLRETKSGA